LENCDECIERYTQEDVKEALEAIFDDQKFRGEKFRDEEGV
jgi:hypothetical protein